MSKIYPWIGFKRREDREKFKKRLFTEYKKTRPEIIEGSSIHFNTRPMTNEEMKEWLNIHNASYGEGETFYVLSDVIKIIWNFYWVIFRGGWEFVEQIEKVLKKNFEGYIYLVNH